MYTAGATILFAGCTPMNRAATALGDLRNILQGTSYPVVTLTPVVTSTPVAKTTAPVVAAQAIGTLVSPPATFTSVPTAILPTVPPPPGYPKNQTWPPVAPTSSPNGAGGNIIATPIPTLSGASGAVPPPSIVTGTPIALGPTQPVSADAARLVGSFRLAFPNIVGLTGKARLRVANLNQAEDIPVNLEADFPLEFSTMATGAHLVALLPSPDGQLLIAETLAHVASDFTIIDTNTRFSRPLKVPTDTSPAPTRFLAWSTDSQRAIIQTNNENLIDSVVVINLSDASESPFKYPLAANDSTRLAAVAYSPDGKQLADVILQPSSFTFELALRPAASNNLTGRTVVKQITNVVDVVERSLQWSPDGKKLAWIMNVQTGTNYKISTQQTELWVSDFLTGETKRLAILGKSVAYNHVPVWTPNSKEVIAIVVDTITDQRDSANNIKRFNVSTAAVKNLTDFKSTRISNLSWSRDSLNLTFSVLKDGGLSGEIWFTDIQGVNKQLLVSSTPPNAPFAWLP